MNTETKTPGPEGVMTIGDKFHKLTAAGKLNWTPPSQTPLGVWM